LHDLIRIMLPEFNDTAIAFQYRTNKELKRAHFLFSSMNSPLLTSVGIKVMQAAIAMHLPVKGVVKNTIFKHFCGGETMEDAAETAAVLAQYNVGVILDYGVEGKEGEEEFDHAVPEFIKAIQYAATQKNIPFVSVKVTGFSRFALLEKIHSGTTLSDAEQNEWKRVQGRIEQVCNAAAQQKVMILIDAEETWIQKPIDELTEAMMAKFNRQEVIVFNTYQMYCNERLSFLKQSFDKAVQNNYLLGAKLVRGAYMEKERARAASMGYPSPIQPDKASTDRDYDEGVHFCLERLNQLYLFVGTHNENSCLKAAAYMIEHNIPPQSKHVYFSQLYGMSDNISFNLAHEGYNVAKYLPYGPVLDVIPYLMRRAQENTSVAGQTGRELSLITKELQRRKLK
jgi:proline dehydrogenase